MLNFQSYVDLLGRPCTSSAAFWPWKNLNYQNPGSNPYVMPTWYNGLDIQTCQGQSYLIVHGPNQAL